MPLGLHDLVQLALLGAGFALLAHFLYSLVSRDEVSARYRPEPVWSSHVHESDGVQPEVRRIAGA